MFVSVIIPTYNRAGTIKRSIESVLNQTHDELEVIVVDDGSKDETQEIVESIDDSRVRYIKLEKNQGVAHARNYGVSQAKYDMIAFHDSDDAWRKDKLEKQIKKYNENPDAVLVYCPYENHRDDFSARFPSEDENLEELEGDIYYYLMLRNTIGAPTILMRKDIFNKIGGFDESFLTIEDWDFAVKASKLGKISYVNEALMDVYHCDKGVNTTSANSYICRCRMIADNMDELQSAGIFDIVVNDMFSRADNNTVLDFIKKNLIVAIAEKKNSSSKNVHTEDVKKAKVSVIIPCYNIAAYIDRCIDSIVKQDYGFENIELILVDDCSTDDTQIHLERIEQNYPDNVLLVKLESNCGPGTARNVGIQYASGEYIIFADGDDIMAPQMINELMTLSQKCDCDVSECSYGVFENADQIVMDDAGDSCFYEIVSGSERANFIINSLKTAVWGRLYKKSFIEENDILFPEGIYNLEDVFFSGLAMFNVKRYCKTEKKLYWYYINPTGLDHSAYNGEKQRKEVQIIDIFLDEINKRRDSLLVNQVADELELYCVWKGLLDPLRKIMKDYKDSDAMIQEALYYARHIIKLFPNAYNNKYLPNIDDISKIAIELLQLASKE